MHLAKNLLLMLSCLYLTGCGSGGTSATSSKTGSTSDYVALNQTIFMGDAITMRWPLASSAAGSIVIAEGKSFAFEVFADKCVAGCSPSELQQVAPGKKRLVLLIGEFDVLNICGGGTETNTFSYNLDNLVRAAQTLYGLEVWIGTVPPVYTSSGTATCVSTTASINQQIAAVGLADGAPVVDFASVLGSPNNFTLTIEPSGIDLPNASGYAAMTNLYDQKNQ
jgi:hypothetical protein